MKKLGFLIVLSGCMVGPNYEVPQREISSTYDREAEGEGSEVCLKRFWEQFGDPVLNELIAEATEGNFSLRVGLERIESARQRFRISTADLFPEIDLNASFERERVSQSLFLSPFSGPATQDLYQWGFDASWEIDVWGRLRRLRQSAEAEWEATLEELRDLYVTMLGEVGSSYTTLRASQQQEQLVLGQIEVARELLRLRSVLVEAGLASEEVLQGAREKLAQFEAELPPVQETLESSLYRLAVLAGRQPEDVSPAWRVAGPLLVATGRIPVGLPSDLLRRRPDIRRAERLLAAASARIGAAIGAMYPTISLTGTIGFQSDEANEIFKTPSFAWNYSPGFSLPFLNFGRLRSQVDIAKVEEKIALVEYEKVIAEALEEVERNLVAYGLEQIRVSDLMVRVGALLEVERLTDVRQKAGLASRIESLESELVRLTSERERLRSDEALSLKLIALYKSLGGDFCSDTP